MKKRVFIAAMFCLVLCIVMPCMELTAQLGISVAAAKKIIKVIDAGSTIVTIVSIIAVVAGAGVATYGFASLAKSMCKKLGKKIAIAW